MARLRFFRFGEDDPLTSLAPRRQQRYLLEYLADLGARTVMVENGFYDRDYLSEFAAFYATSARQYPNACRRLFFFTDDLGMDDLSRAAGGDPEATRRFETAFLGFIVLRPIDTAPFGYTVLRWYPDVQPNAPRVINPRIYHARVGGLDLRVPGLAWQQQDTAVGTCATVALWSMFHSAAHGAYNAIPLTADITRFANTAAPSGARVFPSVGLTIHQMLEAIKLAGMAPMVSRGELPGGYFSRQKLSSQCASLVRSGHQVLIAGRTETGGNHTVCAVGFRDETVGPPVGGSVQLQEEAIEVVYVHDDNLGPGVRCQVEEGAGGRVVLRPAPPDPLAGRTRQHHPTRAYPGLQPQYLVVAVDEDIRCSVERLYQAGVRAARSFRDALNRIRRPAAPLGVTLVARVLHASAYVERELGHTLTGRAEALRGARLGLYADDVKPLSRHVGLVRLGWGRTPMMDVLYDTTQGEDVRSPFCHVCFRPEAAAVADGMRVRSKDKPFPLGSRVTAYD